MPVSEWEAALDVSYPAQPSQIAAIRRAVAEIARDHGAAESKLVQITLAVSEAASNAILHAYRDRDRDGEVRVVVLAHDADCIDVRIRDRGVGPAPRPDSPGLGLGLRLMAHDADGFEIRPAPDGGTEVVLRFEI
ncbi:MAG TPA: anti-sigma regulatory factor [Solirubrobacteraceae bacterium]|nr:anti-sigma regulatory factor [Solirubrobacteraceae bacterium]